MRDWRKFSIPKRTGRPEYILLAALLAAVLGAVVLSLSCGPVFIRAETVWRALRGTEGRTAEAAIVLFTRVPRTCGCVLAGAALAVSGAVIQGTLNNPLAAPNVIGVNAGAGLAVALFNAAAPALAELLPAAAFLGALFGVLMVLLIAERSGAAKITLVLAGVAVCSMFSAGIDAVLTFCPDALNGYSDFRIGGLANLSMSRVLPAAWVILPVLCLLLLLGGEMDVLMLGTETARSLGLRAKPLRLTLLALAAALAGAAVSFCGLLGFVGMIVPHVMRRIAGEESRILLSASALGGALFLTLCDLLARTVFAPYELPVGIVLSLLGGPFFIWQLLRQRGGRIHD